MKTLFNPTNLAFFLQYILISTFLITLIHSKDALATSEKLKPKAIIILLHEALLKSMMLSHKEKAKNRYLRLKPLVDEIFHNEKMAQITSGSFWGTANKVEKNQLTSQFAHLTAATYASQFEGYSGQKFSIISEKKGPQGTILVNTKIISPTGNSVSLVYVLKQIKGKMGIIDILLDVGISELARKRSEFRKILSNKGLNGLTFTLKNKADNLLKN